MYEDNRQKYRIIRESVSAIDVARVLGIQVNQHGRCRCPFHNGHDMNMRIYPGNRGYYCFVCHAGGDCISLAKGLLSDCESYYDAAKWIDETFKLKLFEKETPSIRQRNKQMARKFRKSGDSV